MAKNNDSTITFNEVREDERTINRIAKYLEIRNDIKVKQLKSVLYYVREKNTCKSRLLLEYFGETKSSDCGICSYCISKTNQSKDTSNLPDKIIGYLQTQDLNSRDIQKLTQFPKDDVIFALQNLLENEVIIVKSNNLYSIKK
jgi:ATP-dependent DNA helicase RecQ